MPSPRRKRTKATAPDPPLQQSLDNRAALRSEDVCVGCIAWLPSYPIINQVLKCKNTSEILGKEGYDHPVVVLSVEEVTSNMKDDLTVCIALLTSFTSTPLAHFLSHSANAKYRHYLPIISRNTEIAITQSDSSPPLLNLEDQTKLRKQSYVNLRNIYTISISNLRVYDFGRKARAYQKRLDRASYHVLMNALNLSPEPFTPTDNLRGIPPARLEVLANSEQPRLFCGAVEYQQTIHQVPPTQIRLAQTTIDVPHPISTLNRDAWSLYSLDNWASPVSTHRSYGTTTYPSPPLPPPIPNKETRHVRERRLCTKLFTSPILQLACVVFCACGFWLLWYSYRSRG